MTDSVPRQAASLAPFEWTDHQPTHAHAYLLPTITSWLAASGARRVLDLGCGNGSMTRVLKAAGYDVTGVDASESGIRIARVIAPDLTFVQTWMEEPLPASLRARFDVIVSTEVIEHLLVPRLLCERAREALVPGGLMILSTPYHGYLKNLALALFGYFDRHWQPLQDGGHIKFFSRPTIESLLRAEGFSPTRFAKVGRIPLLAKSMIVEARLRSA